MSVPGSAYYGNFSNGLRHGKGILHNDKEVGRPCYDGLWVENKRHGEGIEWYKDDSMKFYGTFKDDQRNGHGLETTRQEFYEGMWKEGKRHGTGVQRSHLGYYRG